MTETPVARIRSVLEDPGMVAVCREYAQAYLDAAGANASEATRELGELVALFDAVPAVEATLTSGLVSRATRQRALEQLVITRCSEGLAGLLRVMSRNDRLNCVRGVYASVNRELQARQQQLQVKVHSASTLSSETIEELRAGLKTRLGGDPLLQIEVDPTLLGGIVIRVGDTVYDASLKAGLQRLRANLRERCVNEIQRGRDRFSHPSGN